MYIYVYACIYINKVPCMYSMYVCMHICMSCTSILNVYVCMHMY